MASKTFLPFIACLALLGLTSCGTAVTGNAESVASLQSCESHNAESVAAFTRAASLIETEDERNYAFGNSDAAWVGNENVALREAVGDLRALAASRDIVCAAEGQGYGQSNENYFWLIDNLNAAEAASVQGQKYLSLNTAIFCDLAGIRIMNTAGFTGEKVTWSGLGFPDSTAAACESSAPMHTSETV